jgi:transposase-like protein
MVKVEVKCPYCGSTNVSKHGVSESGIQRYNCKNKECEINTFQLDHKYEGCKPGTDEKILETAANASGIRDTSGVLKISIGKWSAL